MWDIRIVTKFRTNGDEQHDKLDHITVRTKFRMTKYVSLLSCTLFLLLSNVSIVGSGMESTCNEKREGELGVGEEIRQAKAHMQVSKIRNL